MSETIHYPALHLTQPSLNRLIQGAVRHPDLDPTTAANLLIGHLASLHQDLTHLMDALEGTRIAQLDPDGVSWPESSSVTT